MSAMHGLSPNKCVAPVQPLLEARQEGLGLRPMFNGVGVFVAIGVLVAVEMSFELGVVDLDQR